MEWGEVLHREAMDLIRLSIIIYTHTNIHMRTFAHICMGNCVDARIRMWATKCACPFQKMRAQRREHKHEGRREDANSQQRCSVAITTQNQTICAAGGQARALTRMRFVAEGTAASNFNRPDGWQNKAIAAGLRRALLDAGCGKCEVNNFCAEEGGAATA